MGKEQEGNIHGVVDNTPDKEAGRPLEFSPDQVQGLKTLEEMLELLRASGKQIGKSFAWPSDPDVQKRVQGNLDQIADCLGVALEIDPEATELELEQVGFLHQEIKFPPGAEGERCTPEQASAIWQAILKLPKKGGQPTAVDRLLKRAEPRRRYGQVTLPGQTNERSEVLTLAISYNHDRQPNSSELFLLKTDGKDGWKSIIPANHPLEMVRSVSIGKPGDHWTRASYETRTLTDWQEEIVPPTRAPDIPMSSGTQVAHDLSSQQAEALLELLGADS